MIPSLQPTRGGAVASPLICRQIEDEDEDENDDEPVFTHS
jgi:hypothetical protein